MGEGPERENRGGLRKLMAITAAALILEIGTMLQEEGWAANELWSVPEILEYANTTCRDFVLRSQIIKVSAPVPSAGGTRQYSDPPYTMQMDRVTFGSRPLYSTNRYMLDRENPRWRKLAGVPKQYHQDQLPTKTFETDRVPLNEMTGLGYESSLRDVGRVGALRGMAGSFGYTATIPAAGRGGILRYVLGTIPYNATVLAGRGRGGVLRQMMDGQTNFSVVATHLTDDITSASDVLTVPNFCKLYIKFGVLKKMLEKEGEGQDLVRARYCGARYDWGIALFRRLIYGKLESTAQKTGVSS